MSAFVEARGGRVNGLARLPGQHVFRSLAFRRAGCGRQPSLHTPPVPIFHLDLPGETQLGFLPLVGTGQPVLSRIFTWWW